MKKYKGLKIPAGLDILDPKIASWFRQDMCTKMCEPAEQGCFNIEKCGDCLLGLPATGRHIFKEFILLPEKERMTILL